MLELRRERERERDRARTVQAATDRARASVEEGDFESAVRHADDALATDSADLNAQNIKAKALAALDERRKQRELKRRAQQTISDARSRFESGAHQDALTSLREFSPGHELVSQALQELQDQLETIQRKIAAENERLEELRRAEEAQRAAAEQALAEKNAREEAEKKAREDKERRDRERREEEARILAEARAAEEQRRQQEKEAQRLAEEQRKEEERKRKEEERKEEEERRRNEERRRKEVEEAQRRAAEQERIRKEDEARRLEAETQRRKEAEEAERRKEAQEARWRKEAEEARRKEAEEARKQKEAQEARRRQEEEDAQRRRADEARAAQAAAAAAATPIAIDENVQFTVFRRSAIQPEHWYPLLCFAHLAERRPDAPDEPDPIEEVQTQARQLLGEDIGEFRSATEDSGYPVAREGELRFVPRMDGVAFNPPERRFLWTESVHREDFRMRADKSMDGRVARGAVSVFYGSLLLAEVQLSIRVDRKAAESRQEETHARPYRRIFASYSHRDTAIVEEFESHVVATGDRYLRDVVTLRAGEVWDERLLESIKQADVFQLFWSWNALTSPLVREEWRQALALNRAHFVRPVYWEEPLPERAGLPPAELKRLHFQRVYPRIPSSPLPSALPSLEPTPIQESSRGAVSRLIRYGSVAAVLVAAVGLYWTVRSGPPAAGPATSQVQTAPQPATEPSTAAGGGAVTAPPPVQNPAVENPSPAPAEPPSAAVKQLPTAVVEPPATSTARRGAPPSRQGTNPPATAKPPQDQKPTAPVPSQPAPTAPVTSQPAPTAPVNKTPLPDTPPAVIPKEPENPPPVVAAKPLPSEAAKPPVPDRLDEERRVRGALERYESAYDNLDAEAVKALYPGAPANLAATFAQYQFYRLELVVQKVTLAPDLNSATAVARLSHFFQPRVGRSQQYVRTQEFAFEKRGNSWIIVRIR